MSKNACRCLGIAETRTIIQQKIEGTIPFNDIAGLKKPAPAPEWNELLPHPFESDPFKPSVMIGGARGRKPE